MCKPITPEMLDSLRACVREKMSPYRYAHTLGVEEAVCTLAALYLPEKITELRAAALLHDLTKEWAHERTLTFLRENGVLLRADEQASPRILHGITAPLVIKAEFPALATPTVLSAVRWHTTGHAEMTLPEALLYLADYIEPGRRFAECVALREAFFEPNPENMEPTARLCHLRQILLRSFDETLAALAAEGAPTCADTVAARDALLFKTNFP